MSNIDQKEIYQRAFSLFNSGQYELAADLLDPLSKAEPDSATVHLLLARIYMSIPKPGKTDDTIPTWLIRSLSAFRKAVKLADEYGGLSNKEISVAKDAIEMFERMAEENYDLSLDDSVEENKSDMTIALGEFGLNINDRRFELPTNINGIINVIGPASRILRGENNIHTWDSLGLNAYCQSGSNSLIEFDISLQKSDFPFRPKEVYRGILTIEGVEIDRVWAYSQLKGLGFQTTYSSVTPYKKHIGDYSILVEGMKYSDQPVLVAISRA